MAAFPISMVFAALAATVVIDGDTVTLHGEKIRIANIDAPELRTAQCDAERRLAIVARERLAQMLAAGAVEVRVGDPGTGRKRDRHGRTLAVIAVDGRDVGEMLIAEQLARPWTGKRQPWCDK